MFHPKLSHIQVRDYWLEYFHSRWPMRQPLWALSLQRSSPWVKARLWEANMAKLIRCLIWQDCLKLASALCFSSPIFVFCLGGGQLPCAETQHSRAKACQQPQESDLEAGLPNLLSLQMGPNSSQRFDCNFMRCSDLKTPNLHSWLPETLQS